MKVDFDFFFTGDPKLAKMELYKVKVTCNCVVEEVDNFDLDSGFESMLKNFKNKFTQCHTAFKKCHKFKIAETGGSFRIFGPGRFTHTLSFSTTSKNSAQEVMEIIRKASEEKLEIISTRFVSHCKGFIGPVAKLDKEILQRDLSILETGNLVFGLSSFTSDSIRIPGRTFSMSLDTTKIISWSPEKSKFFDYTFREIAKSFLLITRGFRELPRIPSAILLYILLPVIAKNYQQKFVDDDEEERLASIKAGQPKWIRKREGIKIDPLGNVAGTGINPVILNAVCRVVSKLSEK